MNKVKEKLKSLFFDNWEKKYPIFISLISLIFAGLGWYSQHNATEKYEKRTNQVIINSTELADYDIDLLIGKVGNSTYLPVTYGNLKFQIDSLKQNLLVIRDVQITNLPKNKSMNYQAYRQDLSDVIYKVDNDIESIQQLSYGNKKVKPNDTLSISDKDRDTFMRDLVWMKLVVENDRKTIKHSGNLYDKKYKTFTEQFDKKNKKRLEIYKKEIEGYNLNEGY